MSELPVAVTAWREEVERQLEGVVGIAVGPATSTCGKCDWLGYGDGEDPEHGQGFARMPCDSCGTRLAGHRSVAHGWRAGGEREVGPIHMWFCSDCVMFHENGELPDLEDGS